MSEHIPAADLVEQAEELCKLAETAVLEREPGARAALRIAMMLKGIALARRALAVGGGADEEPSAPREHTFLHLPTQGLDGQ